MMKIGICNLCGETKELIGKSHVIPDFMYQGIKDENNAMVLAYLSEPEKKPKMTQTGFFDKHVLCKECDNGRIGDLEKYLSHVVYGTPVKNTAKFERQIGPDGIRSIKVSEIDYNKFKLAMLSILWRGHKSKNPFFKEIDIGDAEVEIRNMLLSNDAGDDQEYKMCAIGIQRKDGQLLRMVINPSVRDMPNGGKLAIFHINGIIYFIDLKPKSDFAFFDTEYLTKSGELRIALLDGVIAHEMLEAFNIPMAAHLLDIENKVKLKSDIHKLALDIFKSKNLRKIIDLKDQIIQIVKSAPYSSENAKIISDLVIYHTKVFNRFIEAIRTRDPRRAADLNIDNTMNAMFKAIDLSELPEA